MNWKDVSKPIKSWHKYRNYAFFNGRDMGYEEFANNIGGLVSPPVKPIIYWHTPKRFRLRGFLSGKPIVTKVFWKINTKKGAF